MTDTTPNIPLLRKGKAIPLAERFWKYVDIRGENECWPWTGRVNNAGYGMTSYTPAPKARSIGMTATRAAWLIRHGELPDGCMCHRCDNPICVNIRHLFVGTHKDNMRDAANKGRLRNGNSNVTECIHGHAFTPENTYINPGTGSRACRTCYRAYDQRRRAEGRRIAGERL